MENQNESCKVAEPTIQTELERVYKYLGQIEEKLFNLEPETTIQQDVANDKMLILKGDISKIANRLEKVNDILSVLGK